jgi:hypothetical protein
MDAEQRRLIGQLGAASNLAKYGEHAVGMRLRQAYERAFPTEWERKAQMARMRLAQKCVSKAKTAKAGKPREWNGRTEVEVNRAIREIARPPMACPYCYAELGETFPKRATGRICKRHEAQLSAA